MSEYLCVPGVRVFLEQATTPSPTGFLPSAENIQGSVAAPSRGLGDTSCGIPPAIDSGFARLVFAPSGIADDRPGAPKPHDHVFYIFRFSALEAASSASLLPRQAFHQSREYGRGRPRFTSRSRPLSGAPPPDPWDAQLPNVSLSKSFSEARRRMVESGSDQSICQCQWKSKPSCQLQRRNKWCELGDLGISQGQKHGRQWLSILFDAEKRILPAPLPQHLEQLTPV